MTAPLRQSMPRETIVPVALGERAYDIVIGRDAIDTLGERIKALRPGARTAILTDENVARAHLSRVTDILNASGIDADRGAAGRGIEELRHLRKGVRSHHRRAHRT